MGTTWSAGSEFRPKLTTAILFLCTAAGIASMFLVNPGALVPGVLSWASVFQIAAEASPLVFVCASVMVFVRPRFGYVLGLTSGLIALPWVVSTEFSPVSWNSWVSLNYEMPTPVSPESATFLAIVKLKILSVALITLAVACSSLRLLPYRWTLRQSPLCLRTWPACVVALLLLAVWFGYSVTPYNVPGFHAATADIRILHVQKNGLRFYETMVAEDRDRTAWVVRDDRRLFQYRFEARLTFTRLGDPSVKWSQRARAIVQSPELWRLRTPPARTLRAWNAEGWYVVLKDSRLLAFTTEYGTAPPKEIVELFHDIEKLSASREQTFFERDICLGFCYDPLAALGFSILRLRTDLLRRDASGRGSQL